MYKIVVADWCYEGADHYRATIYSEIDGGGWQSEYVTPPGSTPELTERVARDVAKSRGWKISAVERNIDHKVVISAKQRQEILNLLEVYKVSSEPGSFAKDMARHLRRIVR